MPDVRGGSGGTNVDSDALVMLYACVITCVLTQKSCELILILGLGSGLHIDHILFCLLDAVNNRESVETSKHSREGEVPT